jgi:hypothetical protein
MKSDWPGIKKTLFFIRNFQINYIAGCRIFHKYHPAVHMGNALALCGHGFDANIFKNSVLHDALSDIDTTVNDKNT